MVLRMVGCATRAYVFGRIITHQWWDGHCINCSILFDFFRFVATSPNWKIIHHNYQNSSYDIFTIIIRTIVINAVDNIQYSLLYVTIHWKVLIFHFDDVSIEHCFFPIHFITLKHFHSSSPPLSSTSIFMMWHLTQQHFPIYSFTIL